MNREGFLETPPWTKPRKKDVIIRQSTIESMSLCPARVGYSVEDGFDPTPSEPMAFGSLVHQLIENTLVNGGRGLHANVPYIKDTLVDVLKSDGFDIHDLTNEHHIHNMALEARDALVAWEEQWWMPYGSKRTQIAVEVKIVKPLGMLTKNCAVWVQGTPDFVHAHGIDDWKTAGRGWNAGKGDARIQGELYTWLEFETFQDVLQRSDAVPFTYVVYNRATRKWDPWVIEVTADSISSALFTAWEWAKQIRHKVFPPTPASAAGRPGRGWWCSAAYCSAWNICDFKHMIQDGKLLDIRSSRWTA